MPERAVHEVGQADIVVAVGGDGTIMRVARQVLDAGASSRILGVSGGRLGFLAAFEVEELPLYLDAIRAGTLSIENRHALHWRLLRDGQEAATGCGSTTWSWRRDNLSGPSNLRAKWTEGTPSLDSWEMG